ncbi:MAG: hypothetical protein IH960_02010 [Chloroflexi bacterium]|nr:hypothetical protein [Chloroflexota bacterium]
MSNATFRDIRVILTGRPINRMPPNIISFMSHNLVPANQTCFGTSIRMFPCDLVLLASVWIPDATG